MPSLPKSAAQQEPDAAINELRVVVVGVSDGIAGHVCSKLGAAVVLSFSSLEQFARNIDAVRTLGPDIVLFGGPSCGQFFQGGQELPSQHRGVSIVGSDAAADLPITAREQSVLLMLYRGLTNREIAEGVGLSASGVKAALARLFSKFDVTNRTELVGAAVERGVLQGV